MLKLQENESILLVVHKHWFVLTRSVLIFGVLFLVPPIVLSALPALGEYYDAEKLSAAVNFFLSLYIMILVLLLFLLWMDHYLDMWIVTTKRVIDIEQIGLFSRTVSEVPLDKIQDVTIEIRGVVETFLKFGKLRIQTAGERDFVIEDAPNLYEIKDAILKHSRNSVVVNERG